MTTNAKSAIKRRRLNPEAVIRRAVEMVNESGNPDTLSLAELAASLDVKPPSLYNHVSGMDDLRAGVKRYAWQRLARTMRHSTGGQSGRKALLYIAYAFRQFAHDNPGIYHLLLRSTEGETDPEVVEASAEILNTLLLVFGSAGVTGEDGYHAVRGLRSILHGFVLLEMSGGFGMDLEVEKSFSRAITAYIDGVLEA